MLTLLHLVLSFFLLRASLQWNYNQGGTNWGGGCAASSGQSPINIDQPFTYEVPDISFHYNTVVGAPLLNDGNNLKIQADFGFMMYKGVIFNSQELVMLAPSEHSFGPLNTRYALELQLTHTNAQSQRLVVSVLFSTSMDEPGLFLNQLGFDSVDLKKLSVNQDYPLKDVVDLQTLINNSKRYLAYSGSTTRPPCFHNTTWIIIADTIKASRLQVANFPEELRRHTREQEPRGARTIRTSVENILKQPGQTKTHQKYPGGPETNKIQLMKKLYRDYLVISSQVNVNTTAAQMLQNESPIIDTDFPPYGKLVVPPQSDSSSQGTQNSTKHSEQTLVQEPLSSDEQQALKDHMKKEIKSELFNSAPKPKGTTMQDGTKSEKGEGDTQEKFVDKFISGETQAKQGTALFQLHSSEVYLSRENANTLSTLIELASNGVNLSQRAIDYFDTSAWPSSCKTGLLQSPINIDKPYYPDPYPLNLKFTNPSSNQYLILNDGFNVKVQANFGTLSYGTHQFQSYELILHQPSEHTFGHDQKLYDFEVQILSKDTAGTILGVVLLFEKGKSGSNFLNGLGLDDPASVPRVQQPDSSVKYSGQPINLQRLFNRVVNYITYYGSLSSPPCTEGVQWAIAEQVFSISQSQINAFKIMSGRASNVRRTQQSNGRLITQI